MIDLLQQRIEHTSTALRRTLNEVESFVHTHGELLRHSLTWSFTGIGTSEAVARVIARWFAKRVLMSSEFLPVSSWITGEVASATKVRDVFVLVSQGISPNAKMVLTDSRFNPATHKILLTATTDRSAVELAEKHHWTILRHEPEQEEHLLVRVTGPMCALAAMHSLENTLVDPQATGAHRMALLGAWDAGRVHGQKTTPSWPSTTPEVIVFLSAGSYSDELDALRWMWLEGTLAANCVHSDVLSFVHGPFQSLFHKRVTYVMLERESDAERVLFDRAEKVITQSASSTIIRLKAAARDAKNLECFYHSGAMVELMLNAAAKSGIDLRNWPGKFLDEPLFGIESPDASTRPVR